MNEKWTDVSHVNVILHDKHLWIQIMHHDSTEEINIMGFGDFKATINDNGKYQAISNLRREYRTPSQVTRFFREEPPLNIIRVYDGDMKVIFRISCNQKLEIIRLHDD
ncbi:MAG: hypothetical protein ACTSVI_12745 [Promethearchaeota archaeon]